MGTIEALKKLAVAIKGSGQVSDISGDKIPEVIEEITAAYEESGASKMSQAELVPEAVGDQVSKAEFKSLLDSLKAAGIMKSS